MKKKILGLYSLMQSIQSAANEAYRFEAIFNHASMGIVMVNHNGEIHAVNPFGLKLFGYSINELMGKPIEVLIPKRYHHKHIDHRNDYIQHPKGRPMGVGMDLYAITKGGTEFPVEISLGNYKTNGNDNVIAFISDISVRKKAELEIEKLNNELEATVEQRTKELTETMHELERSKDELSKLLDKEKELGELKSRFVSMASHEFRTPLSTVLSSTYLIQKYTTTEDQPKRDRHLERIVSSVKMLTEILNDFLSVGKIEEGKIYVRPTIFNIKDLINSIIEEIRNTLKKEQQVDYRHEGIEEVVMDASLMKHIVMNLMSNASKFSPEASTIHIGTSGTPGQMVLSVKDSGIGIPMEDQKHLRERFFRATNAGNIQGTGLGLHIVSKYTELMNGTMVCNSELNKGTEFILTFNTKTNNNENDIADRGQ